MKYLLYFAFTMEWSFSQGLMPVTDKVSSVIYTVQNKYCGRHFCSQSESYLPPVCLSENGTALDYRQWKSPCRPCSCSEDCVIYGECCADKHIGAQYMFDCHGVFLHQEDKYSLVYSYFVTKCPVQARNYTKDLADKCEHGELGYVEDGRIVTSLGQFNTSVNFRNKYCALCYGVEDYQPWKVYVTCTRDFDASGFPDLNALIRAVKESQECAIGTEFRNGTFDVEKICYFENGLISSCNVTGEWKTYNRIIEAACLSYLNPVDKYRNIFCALCNGFSEHNLTCPDWFDFQPKIPDFIPPFSAILNFDRSDMEVEVGGGEAFPITRIGEQAETQCRQGDIYDNMAKKCREKYCPLIHPDDNCTKVTTEDNVVTIWKASIIYLSDVLMLYGDHKSFGDEVISQLEEMINDCGFTVYYKTSRDYAVIKSPHELQIKESHLDFRLIHKHGHGLEKSREKLSYLKNVTIDMDLFGDSFRFMLQTVLFHRHVSDMLFVTNPEMTRTTRAHMLANPPSVIDVPLQFNISCAMIRYEKHEVYINGSSINASGVFLIRHQYFQKENDFYTCVDYALFSQEHMEGIQTESATSDDDRLKSDDIQRLVTVVCFSCSLFFLLITFFIHVLIKELHTVPGINLIFLTVSLFAAQFVYLFGAGATAHPPVCLVLGVLIHYLWLVVFAWMNICCVHMFRVFSDLFKSINFIHKMRCVIFRYMVFAFGCPVLIVGANITVAYMTTNYTSFGYGQSMCFVASGLLSVVFFGVPIGITLLVNSVLVILTLFSLRRTKPGHEYSIRTRAADVTKFFKLSTVTGMSWLFGFLGYALKRDELMYVFTVLTGCQGLFIFLSFVVSRRVFNLLRDRFRCLRGQDSTSGNNRTLSPDRYQTSMDTERNANM